MKILLVEDDVKLAKHLIGNLQENHFTVTHFGSATELEKFLRSEDEFQLIILDRLLGGFDTKALLPVLREKRAGIPVLVLSAINTPYERAEVLNLGADDYMGKPFSTPELLARINVLRRRNAAPAVQVFQHRDFKMDLLSRVISVGGLKEELSTKEFLLLRALTKEPGRVLNKDELLECVWGHTAQLETNVIESTISNLRRKLENLQLKGFIKNMRNVGYWVEK